MQECGRIFVDRAIGSELDPPERFRPPNAAWLTVLNQRHEKRSMVRMDRPGRAAPITLIIGDTHPCKISGHAARPQ